LTTNLIIYVGAPEGYEAVQDVMHCFGKTEHVPALQKTIESHLEQATALLDASMKVRISDEMVRSAPELRVISCATTGSDHIERAELNRRKIPVHTLREDPELLQNITPAAELSWALVLASARRLAPALMHTAGGQWNREEFPGLMLNGRQLGLIGCGRIGGWMSRYGHAFGMNVVGYDPHIDPWPAGIERLTIEEVFETSDVISIHVHLSEETRGLVSPDLIQRVKRGAILINTSRGGIADETSILRALESGQLGAAGLDVLEGEPDISDHPLVAYARKHDNLIITPHCGGFSPDAVRRVCHRAAEKILPYLDND
tara:strand:- start:224 stop:1171 length:948 start_codon:yes stop_codon:yes gene_type:complete